MPTRDWLLKRPVVEEEAEVHHEDADQEVESILFLVFLEEVILLVIIATKKVISQENVVNLRKQVDQEVLKVKMVDVSYAMKKAIRKLIVQKEEVDIVVEDIKTEIDLFLEIQEALDDQEANLTLEKPENTETNLDHLKERVFGNNHTLKVDLLDMLKNTDPKVELTDLLLQNVEEDHHLVLDQEAQKTLKMAQDIDQCRMIQSADQVNLCRKPKTSSETRMKNRRVTFRQTKSTEKRPTPQLSLNFNQVKTSTKCLKTKAWLNEIPSGICE